MRGFQKYSNCGFHGLQDLWLPGSCSAGLSEARFRRKIKIFRKQTLPPPGWPRIVPTSIWCKMSAIRGDYGALGGGFQRDSLRKCTTARFRGGRLGGLPAFLRRDFGEKSRFRRFQSVHLDARRLRRAFCAISDCAVHSFIFEHLSNTNVFIE